MATNYARRSFGNCRRLLAKKLRSFELATTTSAGAANGTTLAAVSLANLQDSQRYRNWWVYAAEGANAGQVRKVGEQALNPQTGTLTVGPAFTNQVANALEMELHKLLPPLDDQNGFTGLRTCLNLALQECWTLSRLVVVGVNGQATYDLSAYGDWLEPDAVSEFYAPALTGSLVPWQWPGFNAYRNGEKVELDTSAGITDGSQMLLQVTRPLDTYIKKAGVWTDQSSGFTADSDECLMSPDRLVMVALVHAYEALADAASGNDQKRYEALGLQQRRLVNAWKATNLPHPSERPSHPANQGILGGDWTYLVR